jgi:hypothetical protein
MFTRRQEFTCTQAEFMSATYNDRLLLNNEALYVLQPDGTRDVYFGDGVKTISQLRATTPSISYSAIKGLSDAAAASASNASVSETNAANSAAAIAASTNLINSIKTELDEHKLDYMPHRIQDLKNNKIYKYSLQMSEDGQPQIKFEEVI